MIIRRAKEGISPLAKNDTPIHLFLPPLSLTFFSHSQTLLPAQGASGWQSSDKRADQKACSRWLMGSLQCKDIDPWIDTKSS